MKKTFMLSITLIILMAMSFGFIMTYPETGEAKQGKNIENSEIRDELRLMQSLYLINSLDLSSDQINALIPIMEEAEAIHSEIEAKREEQENLMLAKMKEINQTLADRGEPSEEDITAIMNLREEGRAIMEPYKEKGEELIAKVDEILTDEQKEKIKDYNPKKALKEIMPGGPDGGPDGGPPMGPDGRPPMGPDGGPHDGGPQGGPKNNDGHKFKMIEKILQSAREGSDEEYTKKKDMLLGRISEKLGKRLPWSEVQKKIEEVSLFLDNVRSLSNEDFEAQKEDLKNQVADMMKPGGDRKFNTVIMGLIMNSDLIPVLKSRI